MSRLVCIVLLCGLSAYGQAVTQVSGRVTDATGAAVPNAAVEAPGFSTKVVNDVQLRVNIPATLNVELEVGAVAETVAVTAEAIQVNTTDATIGNAIGNRAITQLPLNARNIAGLLALQPGVVFTSEGDTDSRNGAVNGARATRPTSRWTVSMSNDQMERNAFTIVLRMTPDSVQELRMTTANANAEMGRTSGAQLSLVTKSGTNDLNGSLFWYHRNTATTANEFFLNAAGLPRIRVVRAGHLEAAAVADGHSRPALFADAADL